MNKKFSTLLAGVALLGAMSANAAVNSNIVLSEGANSGLYQLENKSGNYLSMDADGKLTVTQSKKLTSDNLASTLWCVTVTEEGFGKEPIYDFLNKATGQYLTVTLDGLQGVSAADLFASTQGQVVAGGEIEGWAFSKVYASGVEEDRPLYSYFTKDSVVAIHTANNQVGLKKMLATEVETSVSSNDLVTFSLKEADPMVLSARAINTIFGMQDADKGVKLKFDKDKNKTSLVNYFSEYKFWAEESGDQGFVRVLTSENSKLAKDSVYVYVDTAYANVNGEKFLKFNTQQLNHAVLSKNTSGNTTVGDSLGAALNDQSKFMFTYWPSKDSLVIQVKQATYDNDEDGVFSDELTKSTIVGNKALTSSSSDDKNYVTVQDLVEADEIRIVTIYDKKETEISFGFAGCDSKGTGKISVDNGLYFIRNAKGQYLASPIHKNGTEYEWVTVKEEEQLPAHMPAFQWVVFKTQSNDKLAETSPISINNREYTDNATLQLYANEGAKYAYIKSGLTLNGAVIATDSLTFEVVSKDEYPEAYNDSLLGYKNIKDAEYLLEEYTFKYLHPYATGENSKYLAKNESDSLLNVLNGKDAFRLIEGEIANYGVAKAVADKAGVKVLRRTEYSISLDGAYMWRADEQKYAMSEYFNANRKYFFKENNHYEGEDYYAIVEAVYSSSEKNKIGSYKAGVTDDILDATLKIQPLKETRTSAFAINPDNTPLYRRFNTVLENAVEGREDSTKVLMFKEYYRGEYLMDENNKKFQNEEVDYLGIWTVDKATGLSFYVDSAVINKTARGYIKPQYFVYVNRQVQPGVDAIPCPLEHNHGVDADGNELDAYHCSHATPGKAGYIRAKYLVSFADSLNAENADKLYQFGKYTRVGFVDAMHIGDSLIFLVNGFENQKLADLDTAKIIANYKATNNTDKIIDLSALTDKHHNYTWSFRFIAPEKVAAATEAGEESLDVAFLVESNKAATDADIAPKFGQWLKSQNGCLVLSNDTEFEKAKLGGSEDNALVFNIANGSEDDLATDNEEIATSEVTVIAQNGAVRIANAEGKKVVITNILGQTVANTVITSSDATIAAPQGVVVVAVEGEEAVKAIVK